MRVEIVRTFQCLGFWVLGFRVQEFRVQGVAFCLRVQEFIVWVLEFMLRDPGEGIDAGFPCSMTASRAKRRMGFRSNFTKRPGGGGASPKPKPRNPKALIRPYS